MVVTVIATDFDSGVEDMEEGSLDKLNEPLVRVGAKSEAAPEASQEASAADAFDFLSIFNKNR